MRVVLEDQQTGVVYEIERMLKGGSTQAEIYRQDQPETPIVQGTKQVTDYVARELTGLSHTAFVATFFTRQKELSFFGDLGPTQRREQVGRLLGLETIRVAQKRIGEQRTRKQAESRVKREQYEEQSKGIDFPAERARFAVVITEQTTQRDTARLTASMCKQETAVAAGARDLAQQRFAADAALRQEMARVQGEIQRVEEMRSAAQRDLIAIAEAEQEIVHQQTHAAGESALREALLRHDAEKAKLDESNRLNADLQQLLQDRQKITSVLSAPRTISESRESATTLGATNLVAAFDREIAKLASIDLEKLRLRLEAARSLAKVELDRTVARAKLDHMEKLAAELTQRIEALTVGGPPAERLSTVQRERLVLQQSAASSKSAANQTEQRARQLQSLERSLRASELGEVCPTCARPFQTGEAEKTLQALTEQIRLLENEIATERSTAQRLESQASQLAASEAALSKENDEYLNLIGANREWPCHDRVAAT